MSTLNVTVTTHTPLSFDSMSEMEDKIWSALYDADKKSDYDKIVVDVVYDNDKVYDELDCECVIDEDAEDIFKRERHFHMEMLLRSYFSPKHVVANAIMRENAVEIKNIEWAAGADDGAVYSGTVDLKRLENTSEGDYDHTYTVEYTAYKFDDCYRIGATMTTTENEESCKGVYADDYKEKRYDKQFGQKIMSSDEGLFDDKYFGALYLEHIERELKLAAGYILDEIDSSK